jgi:twitching motility protein PilT
MTIQQLLQLTITKDASDLHLVAGFPPIIKVSGELFPVPGEPALSSNEIEAMMIFLVSPERKGKFEKDLELDFSFDFEGKGRFRGNIYRQKGTTAISLRLIPVNLKNLAELNLPTILSRLTDLKQGFILITGPTGHGKSTTLSALINKINQTRSVHIVTIEDPIEYVYPLGRALVSQREVFSDTRSWGDSLRSVLREDPDVVLIGEMRDLETISSAVTIAETGHLVFATLHTNSAAQSVDRIIDVFPENQQAQIRLQFAATFEAIISIRLIPSINPGRIPATEILFATPAARNIIREGKTHLIDNLIQTSAEFGMMTLESSLATLVREGRVSLDEAMKYALRPEQLMKQLR